MTAAVIIAVLVVAVFLYCKRRGRAEAPPGGYYDREALRGVIDQNKRREAAELDYKFYAGRVSDLEIMLAEAEAAEAEARRALEHIEQLNRGGAVVNDKNTERARRALYQQQRRRLSLENQLHAARRGKAKAESILTE